MEGGLLDPHTWEGLEYLESVSGPGAIAEVIHDYMQDAPSRLARMQSTFLAEDWPALERLAHDLKSNSATIGALALSTLAERIEVAAAGAERAELADLIQAAETCLPMVLTALTDRLKRYPG